VSTLAAQQELYRHSIKDRPTTEYVCEYLFRPVAQVVVLVLRPLRVPPPAVVLANATCGVAAAVAIFDGRLLVGALLLQAKTVLDNADGQLARATGRTSVFGRYLDSESDLAVNAVVFAALGSATGRPWLALTAFLVLTLVLSVDFNFERLYRQERGDAREAAPHPDTHRAAVLAGVYAVVYGSQDRLIETFAEWRLRALRADPEARLAWHDRASLCVLVNLGLSTQLAVLGLCLAVGRIDAYLWFVLACGAALVPLVVRRDLRARRARRLSIQGGTE
jgi:phosphatidylglycerophosphate synthase